jgi:hypothetical protein
MRMVSTLFLSPVSWPIENTKLGLVSVRIVDERDGVKFTKTPESSFCSALVRRAEPGSLRRPFNLF